jgi:molybdopterin-guanine dinucleotide biosynthesis protein A
MKVTGIILAGGKSQRMGQNKALLQWNNKYLIEYSIEALQNCCDEILISSNDTGINFQGLSIVRDEISGIGPLGGIYSCLRLAKNEKTFVLSCDIPLITGHLVLDILDKITFQLVGIPFINDTYYEPLCAFYHKKSIPFIKNMIDNKNFKVIDLMKYVSYQLVPFLVKEGDSNYPNLFMNINSMEEFDHFQNSCLLTKLLN